MRYLASLVIANSHEHQRRLREAAQRPRTARRRPRPQR